MYVYFVKLLNMSLASSVLILAVLAVRFLLRKAPRKLVCLLWVIVALRLIAPVSISSALSAFNYIGRYHSNDGQLSYIQYTGHTEKPEAEFHIWGSTIGGSDGPTVVMHTPSVYLPTLMNIWIAGMLILAVYAIISYLRIYQHTRVSIKLRGNIYQCDGIPSPFILGLIRPRIYLPSGLNPDDIKSVVSHERSHTARFDHVWKPLGYAILCIHWFNPLVWVSYILLCRDIELACDEKVIADMSVEQKQSYSAALLRCSMPQKIITACPLAFGEVGVKQRVKGILNYRKPGFWVVALALVLCAVLSIVFLTNPEKHEIIGPLMGFGQYLPEGYSLVPGDGSRCSILKAEDIFGYVQFLRLDYPEGEENFRDYAWAHQQEIWTQFGIDYDNEYLEYTTSGSPNADCMGWFGIYDPEAKVSTGDYHYLYLVPDGAYDLTVVGVDNTVEWIAGLFGNYLAGISPEHLPQEYEETIPILEPEIITPEDDVPDDLVMYPGDELKLGLTDVIEVKTAYAVAPDGSHYQRYEYTVGQNCSLYVFDADTVDGEPRWVLAPQDGISSSKKVYPGIYPIYCTTVLWDPETYKIPVRIEQTEPTTMDFPLPEGVTFDTMSKSNYLIIKDNKLVGELRRDIQIFDLLENRNEDEIWRYLARGLQDGWYDEYIIEYWDNSIAVNYQITEESSGEQVQTGHWFFQRGRAAYELIFYYDMISREDANVIRKAMGVG